MHRRMDYFILPIAALLLIMTACRQEVDYPAGGNDAQVSFIVASPQMRAELGKPGISGLILQDNTDSAKRHSNDIYIGSSYNYQFPFNYNDLVTKEPWIVYMHLAPGAHSFALADSARHIRTRDQLNLNANQPVSIYYTDSVGYYRSVALQDTLQAATGSIRLRVVHLSPDAGKVFFTINEKPAAFNGFPDTLRYGGYTSFVNYGNPASDTLRIYFYHPGDSATVLARAFLQADPGRSYTLALQGYNSATRSYKDPVTGKTIALAGGLSVSINKNF